MFSPIRLDAHNPGAMTGAGNHTYLLVESGGGATLVDAGVAEPRHLRDLEAQLDRHQARLEKALVTHAHPDHALGAMSIAAAHPGVKCFKCPAPEEDLRYPVDWHPLADGDRIDAGAEVLVAIHTPGHSPDHLAFWHGATGTLFTGDLVVLGSSVMIDASHGGDLGQYLASLRRVLDMAPTALLPAHGPTIHDPAVVLREYIEHRLMRERQIVNALTLGKDSVSSIAEYIYDGLAAALVPAARETVRAHLEKLAREGRALDDSGRWRASR